VTGKVYDPSGQVPLYNAIVYVPNGQIQPFSAGVTCDRCGAVTSGSPLVTALTGPDGTFELKDVPTGSNIPLVIQIGRWRRQVTLPMVITACTSTPITDANLLRLPRNKSEGDIPLIAIATGNADPFECLLRKMGISDPEFTAPGGTGRIHYYVANGKPMATPTLDGGDLWNDTGALMQYDVVLLPCEGGEYRKASPANQNIIAYTSAGGRVFTTHYGYVWVSQPFAPNPFPLTGDWQPDPNQTHNPPNPFTVNVDQSFPKGAAFASWLLNVDAGYVSAGSPVLDVHETRHDLFGVDAGSTRWLGAPNPNFGNQPSVQHMTFNTPVNPPALPDGGPGLQCGRLVFSDFHVTAGALSGQPTFPDSCVPATTPMTPQEKALVFMLFDVSSCIQNDHVIPTICPGARQSCSVSNPCCSGLLCKSPAGTLCGTGDTGCRCAAIISE